MILAVISARMGSSRLPGKVLADIGGVPMLARQIARVARAGRVDKVSVATTEAPADDAVAQAAENAGVTAFRGPDEDVLERIWLAARGLGASQVVRLTADCPLSDAGVIDAVVAAHLEAANDLTANVVERTFPDGLDVEVLSIEALRRARENAPPGFDREHVTPFLYRAENGFRVGSVVAPVDHGSERWTVDYPEDLEFVREVFAAFGGREAEFAYAEVLALLEARPELKAINAARNPALRAAAR